MNAMGLFEKSRNVEGVNSYGKPKLPPGQYKTEKFPVLTYGPTQNIKREEWRFRVWGLVEEEREWTWDEFMKLPQSKFQADFHCVTHWSRFDSIWEGVFFRDFIKEIRLKQGAKHVLQHAYGGYTTNLPLAWMIDEDVMFAHTIDGKALEADHGGPMRIITPKRYAWKGAKWIKKITFSDRDQKGFWEVRGYSNTALPWNNDRYG